MAVILILAALLAVAVLISFDIRRVSDWDPWAEFDRDERP